MTDKDKLLEIVAKAKKKTREAKSDIERNMIFVEELLANGVIVPPYKVGEIVYGIAPTLAKYPISICICNMDISTGEDYDGDYVFVYSAICQNGKLKGKKFEFTNFSENVKRTKAEAEERLKECDNNDR